jgi:hypothetical protein
LRSNLNRWLRALCAIGCVSAAAVALAQAPYVNNDLKFGFTPPSGWLQKKASSPRADLVLAYVEPGAAQTSLPSYRHETDAEFMRRINQKLRKPADSSVVFQANITMMCIKVGSITLNDYARETRTKAQEALHAQRAKGGTVTYEIMTEKPRKLAGAAAVERLDRVLASGGTRVHMREVICIQDGRLFTISLTVPEGALPRYNREFDRVLASFTWKT